jgi:adenylate kinase
VASRPPRQADRCDKCQGGLVQRPDDTAAVVRNRIGTYHDQTAPLVDYYQKQGSVRHIDGNADIEAVTGALFAVLDGVGRTA